MKNQLKAGVVLSYINMGLNMLIQLIYTPVMIRLLGKSEYGLYNLVGSVVSYLSLFSLGFTGAYMRFRTKAEVDKDKSQVSRVNGMFLTLFGIMSSAAIVCGFILAQYTPQILGHNLTQAELDKAKILMYILVVNIALSFPSSLFNSIISAHEAFLFQRVLSLLATVFNPLICLPLLLSGFGSVSIVAVTTLITVTSLVCSIYYCFKKLNESFIFNHFQLRDFKEIAVFSSFLFLNMIIDQVNWSVDKYILGRVSGTNAVAVYGVGAQINSMVISFSTAISSVFSPRINRIALEQPEIRRKHFDELFIKVGRIQFLILGLLISGFAIFGEYFIVNIYVGEQYKEAYMVAILLIVPALIPLIQNLGIEIQRAVNMHKVRSVMYFVMAIVNVLISIPLARKYGPSGSAFGTAFSILLSNGLAMNLYYKYALKMDINLFWKNILSLSKGMILPIAATGIILHLHSISATWEFFLFTVGYIAVYGISMYTLGMNQDEKKFAHGIIRRVCGRKVS